ncbi:unnamed protein product [Cuscuta epithymum]|uniref:Bifunctional inhibitor/plant lipid transfer protein/seed storage helical domain-containing protein n=1 Tax=Cuscuta epithymum TaxID=186058 RepID=A0AAV0EQU1_9ASTE|nr:unnamed protein product [Cuscuta epithymum]
MALSSNAFCSLAVYILAVWPITAAAEDCGSVIMIDNLADCLSFVSNGSTKTEPQGSCCSGIKLVLKTNRSCLCEGFKSSADFGVSLNVTKAMTLPSACNVSDSSVSNCGLNSTGNPSSPPAPTMLPLSPIRAPATVGSLAGSPPVPVANSPIQGNSVSSIVVPAFVVALAAAAFFVLLF